MIIPPQTTLTRDQLVSGIKALVLAIGYGMVYPFENVRVRMGADVERDRVYTGVRDCLAKMRKVEGKGVFYRGFGLSLVYIEMQYFLATEMYRYLTNSLYTKANKPVPFNGLPLFLSSFLLS